MPTDYSKGKRNKITSANTDLVYIGSTCSPFLCHRLRGHYKLWKDGRHNFTASYIILDAGDHAIELLETYPCESSDELRAREQHWIREHGERACNWRRALLTAEEKREAIAAHNAEYSSKANADRLKAQQVAYYYANVDKVKTYQAEYRAANTEA